MHEVWINTTTQLYFKISFKLNKSTIIWVGKMLNITELCGRDLD